MAIASAAGVGRSNRPHRATADVVADQPPAQLDTHDPVCVTRVSASAGHTPASDRTRAARGDHVTFWSMGEQWEFEGPQGPVSVKVTPRMRTNSGDTCCAAALQHQGIVLQPSFLVGTHLSSGALVEVLPQYRSIELGVYAVYPSRKYLTPKVRALIHFLAGAFNERAWPA